MFARLEHQPSLVGCILGNGDRAGRLLQGEDLPSPFAYMHAVAAAAAGDECVNPLPSNYICCCCRGEVPVCVTSPLPIIVAAVAGYLHSGKPPKASLIVTVLITTVAAAGMSRY